MLQRLLWPALCTRQFLPALCLQQQSGPVPTWQLRSNHRPMSSLPSRLRRRELWHLRRRLLWRCRHRQKLPTWVDKVRKSNSDAKTCPRELWCVAKGNASFFKLLGKKLKHLSRRSTPFNVNMGWVFLPVLWLFFWYKLSGKMNRNSIGCYPYLVSLCIWLCSVSSHPDGDKPSGARLALWLPPSSSVRVKLVNGFRWIVCVQAEMMTKLAGALLCSQAGYCRLARAVSKRFFGHLMGPLCAFDDYKNPVVKTMYYSTQSLIQGPCL